jgi:hypothetical protein
LDEDRGGPGLKQLRRSLLDYMAGDKFHPAAQLTPAQVQDLWTHNTNSSSTQPARVFDPDLDDGSMLKKPKP